MNRPDCALSVNFGFGFGLGFSLPAWAIPLTSFGEPFDK
jgi:hypothetical protein